MMQRKVNLKPDVDLLPLPVVLVGVGSTSDCYNLITVSWIGVVCSEPPLISISIRPERYSHKLLLESDGWTINIPTEEQVMAVDFCGIYSGRDLNKFAKLNLTPEPALHVKAPLVREIAVNIECRKISEQLLGSHRLFIGEVVALYADAEVVTDNEIDAGKLHPPTYNIWDYWSLGHKLGIYGMGGMKTDE